MWLLEASGILESRLYILNVCGRDEMCVRGARKISVVQVYDAIERNSNVMDGARVCRSIQIV